MVRFLSGLAEVVWYWAALSCLLAHPGTTRRCQGVSKLDANSGFWQISLSAESSLLTTFITPFGRYSFKRLPFGITSAPEHFQRRMSTLLEGIEGVVYLMDDILVYRTTQSQHDERLFRVLQRLQSVSLTLNRENTS